MFAAKEWLGQLLSLAAERRWTPLARELCDLVLNWPNDCPQAVRVPLMALFETALRESDAQTQGELASRMAGHSDIPLRLMNAVYLSAPAPVRREILMRAELEGEAPAGQAANGEAILSAARNASQDFGFALGSIVGIPTAVANAVLTDASGEALAVLCRGTGLDRATFSAIALLRGARDLPLPVFDTVPDRAAAALVHDWRKRMDQTTPQHIAAAE